MTPERTALRAVRPPITVPRDRAISPRVATANSAPTGLSLFDVAIPAVLGQEQLLQRRLAAQQLGHSSRREDLEQRLDRPSYLATNDPAVGGYRGYPMHTGQIGNRTVEGRLN